MDAFSNALDSGTIPAWAGEPFLTRSSKKAGMDHPRVGGGTIRPLNSPRHFRGPSPRGRGNHVAVFAQGFLKGTIPAWAGEPSSCRRKSRTSWDHPRVGGGTGQGSRKINVISGPSPRGRGNRRLGSSFFLRQGTIPAWAGEPLLHRKLFSLAVDHPRVGGGTPFIPSKRHLDVGPSPRGRGNQLMHLYLHLYKGTIPAWAGEPC